MNLDKNVEPHAQMFSYLSLIFISLESIKWEIRNVKRALRAKSALYYLSMQMMFVRSENRCDF